MKIKLLVLTYFIAVFSYAQQLALPKVIPPAPETAAFTKFIDFPANLSLGLPTISIPLYEIKTAELELPISISYDASGLKPNEDETGLIGLKWSLNAFGLVSRSINNRPDERFYDQPIPVANELSQLQGFCGDVAGANYNNMSIYQVLDGISMGGEGSDAEPDIFSYRLPNGESNKFVLTRGGTLATLQPVMLKETATKLQYSTTGSSGSTQISHFEVTDTKGTFYRFGQSINNTLNATESGSRGRTAWLLTEMISPTKKDTISFEYEDVQFFRTLSGQFANGQIRNVQSQEGVTVNVIQEYGCIGPGCPSFIPYSSNRDLNWSPNEFSYTQKKLTKIKFKSGYLDFSYKFIDNKCVLNYIRVYSNDGFKIKTIQFKQSKFPNIPIAQMNWLKLDELVFEGESNNTSDYYKYGFSYNTGTFPKKMYNNLAYAIDHWGFYNGQNSNNGFLPSDIDLSWPEAMIYGSDTAIAGNRTPNSNFAKIGILNTITFPSKGTRVFEYEGNTSNNLPVGGIRIQKISNNDGDNHLIHTFNYGAGGVSKDYKNVWFYRHYNFAYQESAPNAPTRLSETFSLNSTPNIDITMNGMPVIYQSIDEYIGEANNNIGKIRHEFNGLGTSATQNMAQYTCGGAGLWSHGSHPISLKKYYNPIPKLYYNIYFPDINETKTTYYDADNHIVKEVINNYLISNAGEAMKGCKSTQVASELNDLYIHKGCWHFYFYNYSIYKTSQIYGGTKVTDFKDNQPSTSQSTSYTYNDKYIVSSEQTTNSLGEVIKKEYKYATDLNGVEQSPYMSQMVSANRISEPVITKTFNGSEKISESHTKYGTSSATGNILLPIEVHANKGSNSIDITTATDRKILYTKYGKWGNYLEYKSEEGMYTTILWDKNGINPLAKIEGATFEQVRIALGTTEQALQSLTIAPANIRTSLTNAMVTTYTYKPLVGVTSITDPRGNTVYYSYDSFGRLKDVKDLDGNILSTNEYNYKQ